jgi:hypothetical protein
MIPVQVAQNRIGAQHLQRQHRAGDVAPVDPVRRPAAHQRQQEQRRELDEADQPELEGGRLMSIVWRAMS